MIAGIEPVACPLCGKPALLRRIASIPFIFCPCVGLNNVKLVRTGLGVKV